MFNKFIKKSSKFFAVLLTATLAFTPLSYGATPTSFSNFNTLLSDGTVSDITLNTDLTADTTDTTLGEQVADSLTINGATNSISGADSAYGMKIDAGSSGPLQEKITEINNIEFKNFYKNDDGSVIYNKAGNLTIKNSSFTANKGTVRGGAIYHKTKSDEQPEEHRYGFLTIQNSFFSGNEAFAMGAIHSEGVLTITDTVFENNKAEYMGVLGVTGSKKDKATLTNVTFSNNSSTNNDSSFPNSGVIYLGGEARISIADSTFENNTSAAEAGAIGSAFLDLGEEDPDFKYAQLDVTGSTFKKNTAQTNGGAIDNYFYGSEAYPTTNNETFEPGYVYVKDTNFEENKARNGGAVYNHGNIDGNSVAQMIIDGATKFIKNIAGISATVTGNGGAILNEGNLIINDGVEFSTNSASGKGGAIFNTSSGSEGGVIDFNGDATFIDNYTASEDNKNDIYNDGTLNFNGKAGGATVTMTGGIVGSGDTNIGDAYNTNNTVSVKLGSDAKLEQDSISIEEGSQVTVNAANVKVTGINNILYNSGSLVLYSTSTDTIDFANPIMDVISVGTTTIKTENNIGANINMGDNELQQYGLVIEEDSSLTVNANKLNISSQVVNDGSLIFKSATSATEAMVNKSTITTNGTGSLTIDGVVANQEGTGISEANIYILENSSFTASANDLTVSSEDGISNEGNLIFKSETDVQTNGNNISGNGKFFIDGTLTNTATVEQSSVTVGYNQEAMVINQGMIKSTDVVITEDSVLINEGVIKSTHVVVSEDATLVAKGEIDTYDEGNIQGGKITNNGDFIIYVLNDEGEPDTVPNYNTIDGTGTLVISSTNFNVQENARIDQGAVIIADSEASLKVGVSSITVSPDGAVQNAGKFTLTGEGTNNNKVEGYNDNYGETVFDEDSNIVNNANIIQSTVTVKGTADNTSAVQADFVEIKQNAQLTTDSSDITGLTTSTATVKNDGTLIFKNSSVENNNVIEGDGTLQIGDYLINNNTISQSTITVGNTLVNNSSITASYITGDYVDVVNSGKLILNLSEDAGYGLTNLTGVGTSSITVESGKTVTMNNTGTIEQATIETYGAGTLLLTGNKIIANIVNYMTGNCLDLATRLEGTLDNNPANPDTEGVVNILDGGSVSGQITNSTGTINILAPTFNVETGITSVNTSDISKNVINIGSGTARSVVVSTTAINYQTINISTGSLTLLDEGTSQGTIDTSSITVTAVSTFTANASRVTNTTIQNDGLVQFVGGTDSEHSVNTSTITSSAQGIKGKLTIDGILDNQEGTEISRQNIEIFEDSELYTSASDIKDSLILNDGNLYFVGGDTVNTSTITVSDGFGYLTIQADKVTNMAEITQNTIEITENSTLKNNSNITAVNAVVNYGTIQNSSGIITSNYVENNNNGTINNEQYGVIISTSINNYGTIVSSGTITVKEDLYSNGTITVSSGTLTAGYIENDMDAGIYNEQYGVITSTNIGNWGTIVSSGSITAKGELNNYAGTITVSSGTVDANYIGNLSNIYNEQYGVITSTNVDNWGTIISSGSITVAEALENKENALIENEEGASIQAGVLNSSGTITNLSSITVDGTLTNNETGLIENKEDATIEAGDLINSGIINSSGTITVSNELNNSGTITSSGTITTVNADNSGTINNEDGGEIYSDTAIHNTGTINSNADGMFADIQNDGGVYNVSGGTISFNVTGGTLDGIVNIKQSSVTVSSTACIGQNTINLEGTELKLEKESNLRTSNLNIGEGATFNIMNDTIDTVDVLSVNTESGITWNYKFDVNLRLGTTDQLINTTFNSSTMTINTINVLEDADKATTTELQLADSFAWADITNTLFATTQVIYAIEQDLAISTATVLKITADGYGGFPNAVYDGLGLYFVSGDSEGVHVENVKKWVDDGHGPQDTLVADMSLNGKYEDSVLVSSPDAGTLTGIKTGSFTLRINDNELAQGLTIKGFENAIDVNAADGRLEANNVVFSSNTGNAVITNAGTTVLNGVTFDNTNTATYDVLNNGDLLLETSSSTFTKGIVGEGTTTIKGIAIDMGDATLAQGMVEISHVEGSSLTVKVDKLQYEREGSSEPTVTDLIINNNELVLVGNEEGDEVATLATEIKGFGNTELQKNMDVTKDISQTNINLVGATVSVSTDTGAKVKATTISVDENSSLTADASNIDTFATNGGINNEGNVTFVGGTNNNTITGNQGKIFIEMNKEVINSTGTQISQKYIEIKEGGKFVMNADDVETATDGDLKGIQNNGDLEITGGTNKNIIGRGDAVKGNTIISGIVTNAEGTSVEQSTITINSGASLTASANDLKKATNGVLNSGDLILVGSSDMTNENDITGTGNIVIKSNLTSSTTINQTNIDIVDGTFTHNVADNGDMPKITAANISISTSATFVVHSEVEVSDKVTNDGIFKINVLDPDGKADDVTSKNNIIGKGDMIISSTNYKNDGGTISQRTFTIEDADSSFETDITKFEAYNGITDNGNLIYTGTGTSSSTITGTGELTIGTTTVANITNKEGNEISLSTITVNEGSKFKTNANDITTTVGMVNDAEVTFTGGVNKSTITMTNGKGETKVEGTYFENTAAITQSTITVTNNVFNNVRGSSITATVFNADTTFITDAYDLNISTITLGTTDSMLKLIDDEMQGTDIELDSVIDGSGSLVKEGSAIVTLNGENSYTGTTTITDGALRISSSTNISDRDGAIIYMDGGKLIAAGDMELNSDIVGTFGTDGANTVNIEVEDVFVTTLTANSKIYGSSDIVKTGSGTLNLEMESNSYTGDTKISSGTIRGTTKNINGVVTGNNDGTAVEFYDDADIQGDVVLNKIVDMGAFRKTGTSTMTVTNAFKAITANISNGTLIMNNADVDGTLITDFTVDSSMTVTNATLKGYGNITAKDLIIGQGAKFAPGNSTTTFKVNGNLKFEEDGEYDVEFGQVSMDEAGHYNDNTAVTGDTTIGEDSKITLRNLEGKYYVKEEIDLINSDGTLADGYEYKEENVEFIDNDARGLRPGYKTRISTRVFTKDNALKLELVREKSEYSNSLEFDRSHNEQEAANAIDTISSGNGGDITKPLDAMEKMYYYQDTYDIEGLKAALNDIAGVIHANSTMLTFMNDKIEHVYDKVKERTSCILPCQKLHDKIWAEYYYNTYNVDKNENSPKFDTSVNGFLVGFDMISAKNLTFGITAGYGTSELKQRDDKTTMNDINLGFYGGYETQKWLFKGMLLGGYEQYDTTRTIGFMDRTANSEYNGYSATLDLEAGYKISLNKKDSQAKHKMYLKPYLGVTGSYINNEGFEEKGADSLNLKVEGYDNFAAQARAGIGINGKVKKFGWYAKAGVRQFLTEDYNEIESALLDYKDQTQMKIRSAELDKFSYGGGIGADFALSNAWTIFANGLASFADKSNNYYGNIGLMYKFGCPNNEKKTDEDVEKITAMLNDKMTEEDLLKKQLAEKDKALKDAKDREKELQNRIQKYEAQIVSEQQAQKMKEKTIKTMRLGEKPTFVFGTDKLNGSGKESLKQVARELENYPDAEVLVEGHTDNVGGDEINQKISENRASAVATTLKKDYGVQNNISVIGKGKTEPIASNDTAEGRAKNRRVEVIVTTNE